MNARLRGLLAGLCGLAGAGVFVESLPQTRTTAALIPPAALALAALAAPFPWLGAQLLARGLWWSNLVLGLVLVGLGSAHEIGIGTALTVGCAAALVVADRRALTTAAASAGFRPAAYAGTLQLLLVLALADAQTLLLFGAIEARRSGPSSSIFFGLAVGFVLGFVGLLRLSLWGVGLTMASALTLGVLVGTHAMRFETDLLPVLLVIAAVQLVVPLPMLVSMATKRPLPALSLRARGLYARAVVVALALCAVVTWAVRVYQR